MEANILVSPGAGDILRAANELFAERGYDAVSISAIAERAESSKANIFHHYGNKHGLYFAVMRAAVDRATEHFQRAMDVDGSASERIESAIRGSLSVLFEDTERARLIFREVMDAGPSRGEALANDLFSDEFTTLTRLFADAQGRGQCGQHIDPSFLAFLLISANVMLLHCQPVLKHLPGGDFAADRERYVAMLRDVLIHSVAPPPEAGQ